MLPLQASSINGRNSDSGPCRSDGRSQRAAYHHQRLEAPFPAAVPVPRWRLVLTSPVSSISIPSPQSRQTPLPFLWTFTKDNAKESRRGRNSCADLSHKPLLFRVELTKRKVLSGPRQKNSLHNPLIHRLSRRCGVLTRWLRYSRRQRSTSFDLESWLDSPLQKGKGKNRTPSKGIPFSRSSISSSSPPQGKGTDSSQLPSNPNWHLASNREVVRAAELWPQLGSRPSRSMQFLMITRVAQPEVSAVEESNIVNTSQLGDPALTIHFSEKQSALTLVWMHLLAPEDPSTSEKRVLIDLAAIRDALNELKMIHHHASDKLLWVPFSLATSRSSHQAGQEVFEELLL